MSKKTNLEEMKMQLNRIEHYIRISTEKKYFPDPAPEYSYSGPTIKPIPPYSTRCTKCGYELKPVARKCPQCKDPDPPLNARVEKVLGEEIQYFWDYGWLVKDIDRRGPTLPL